MVKYLECFLRGQVISSWVPSYPEAGVARVWASESVWISMSAVTRSASGHWTLEEVMTEKASSSKEVVVRSGVPLCIILLVEFLANAFAFPSLLLPSSLT